RFGLKNAGTTYQRLVNAAFQYQIGRSLEAYVDDMVIKSNDEKVLITDIAETFDNLWRINMKLNPKKCSFGAEEGKFLGYMVTSKGIRANPKKTKAIADMQSPRTLKEMQILSGKLAALKRLLSRSAEKSLPFFKTLKDITKENKDEYRWTESAEKAFQEMKKVIVELPLLTTPVKEEMLYIYMAAATEVVIVVLLTERKGKQCPIHYVSRTLNEAEKNYAPLEKLALSLLHMSRRLRRYFEAHPIKVITDQPLKQILNKAKESRKLSKYLVELGAYNITYEPRNVIKGQVLADFLSEAPVGTPIEEFFRLPAKLPNKDDVERWTLFTDGTSNNKGSIAGLVLVSPSGVEFTYALRLNFTSTNNEEKYKALLAGLRMARKMKGMDILGPLPQAAEKLKFVIVAIDYFTKWIKVKPLARITRKDVKKFVWGNIVLTYGSEAMIPAEIGMPTHRTMMIREDKNEDELRFNMDFLQERREAVAIREAKYKTKMEQYYNQKVRPMSFKPDGYVFRSYEASRV
ncbi:reverse transcriptase domain-containing protein, partial [Tanacetum coccineum]